MSSKASRKPKCPRPLEPIITRTKSAQQRQQLNKKQKTDKPVKAVKPKLTKPEIKSPKPKKKICKKDAPLKKIDKAIEEVIDQVEYYPNKLKRDLNSKKVVLKPKDNFKVIATANKRKLGVPKKGVKQSEPDTPATTDLSMQEMVRLLEERSLSDEDFMEILTCPSPVWWEDPPDQSYREECLYSRSPEPSSKTPEIPVITISPEPPPKKKTKQNNKKKTKTNKTNKNTQIIKPIEQNVEQTTKKDEKFVKKQLKLESILGNIKNKTREQKNKKVETKNVQKKRKFSESTEGDISDLSFNEEILKNIESMVIPMEKTHEPETVFIKEENEIKEDVIDASNTQILNVDVKQEIKEEKSECSNIDKKRKSSEEVINVDSYNTSISLNEDSNSEEDFSIEQDALNRLKNENSKNLNNVGIPYKKIINDLTEHITVYKIVPEKAKDKLNAEIYSKCMGNKKLETVRGKLNEFFKHCKNNKRIRKSDISVPANNLTGVKTTTDEKENGIQNELEERRCDQCVEKTVNGKTVFSCDKCELEPILHCVSCNFSAESTELYKKHASNCKESDRISWKNNLLLNQT
ncbi:unnamed protein product [Chrysodeixis includens]|uniref:Uncharacterized protein n=1 Tax=Chrysodeixis includens TaxID=689277 RepID=A0A9P0BYX5_CHRIL|nr:unnamed protein product [Chrysodeixis includens]